MLRPEDLRRLATLLVLALPALAGADIEQLAKCQKAFAREGGKYAQRVIKTNLDCTTKTASCQIQCEQGVFGPPCDPNPSPGCCDPDDAGSNTAFEKCMTDAQEFCDNVPLKIANYETRKQTSITTACAQVSQEELCGTQAVGLNFDALNAGCLALDPSYTCSLTNLLACAAGPLEQQLAGQISGLLHPRAGDAVAALDLEQSLPGIPVPRKVTGQIPAGAADLWAITGQADDEIVVKVKTRDDTGTHVSTLHPLLTLLDGPTATPALVADTTVRSVPCNVTNVCGSPCPQLKRKLPHSGTFLLAVTAFTGDACGGGKYRLVVTTPGGTIPAQVANDVPAGSLPGGGQ